MLLQVIEQSPEHAYLNWNGLILAHLQLNYVLCGYSSKHKYIHAVTAATLFNSHNMALQVSKFTLGYVFND